jgi:NAD+ diphosphatase
MSGQFVPGFIPPAECSQPAWWFIYQNDAMLVKPGADGPEVPCLKGLDDLGLATQISLYLGQMGPLACFAAKVGAGLPAPQGFVWEGQRVLYATLPQSVVAVAGLARQLLEWEFNHRFCGACGAPTISRREERAKECPACGHISYPRLSPAIIVSVTRGREILLARSPRFPRGRYSVLAGFVEPGETLEQAVAREIREETGLEVSNLKYFGSQPWPFPDSLMIAFTAQYAGGELCINHAELEDARWCTPENLPTIPTGETISRRLIDNFLKSMKDPAGG